MAQAQPLPDPVVYADPTMARQRLYQLGLTPERLWSAFNFGIAERRNCTANDPVWLPGILTSGKIMRGLRDELVPLKWTISNKLGYATVVHPGGLLAIGVSSGDRSAGDPAGHPSTKTEKGPATEHAVAVNQLGFWNVAPGDFPPPPATTPTYLFLYCVDDDAGIVGAELSLPIFLSPDGRIHDWQERIPLFLSDPNAGTRNLGDADDDDGEEIRIDIERLAS